jgi:hypothetical protein
MSHTAVKAIQTRYAGCHFRSRLEARWAVFFDQLDIPWEYEPEGFETPAGRYLPDFYLPEHARWVEVKGGSFTKRDRDRGAYFAEARWQLGEGYRVLQGDIPRSAITGPSGRGCIQIIAWHQGVVPVVPEAWPTVFPDGEFDPSGVPDISGPAPAGWGEPLPIMAGPGLLLEHSELRDFDTQLWALAFDVPAVNAALTAARSERFGR